MNLFPAIDPIPLPAPVWLFKGLHILTLSLHFIAVEMLLGGLLVAVWLNFRGASRRHEPAGLLRLNASAAIARRLPIVMTYVINLGVPPLLFAQVLYGRALYTSSVLIGVYWISVVFLLMACYWLLYRFAAGTETGRAVWWRGLLAWVLAGAIARILSTNMTLMLRPEVWQDMYAASASGIHLPTGDPTLLPRWLFMLAGGFWVAGLWMVWLASRKAFDPPVKSYLAATGGRLAAVMIAVQAALGLWVFQAQPAAVKTALGGNALYSAAGFAWLAAAVAVLGFAAWAAVKKPAARGAGYVALLLTFMVMLAMTTYRDGIRDLTLLGKGFDVWQQDWVANWSVLILFFVAFVAGLGAVAWLIWVMRRAKPVSENVAS